MAGQLHNARLDDEAAQLNQMPPAPSALICQLRMSYRAQAPFLRLHAIRLRMSAAQVAIR
jgi:hypothetical protein